MNCPLDCFLVISSIPKDCMPKETRIYAFGEGWPLRTTRVIESTNCPGAIWEDNLAAAVGNIAIYASVLWGLYRLFRKRRSIKY